MPLESFRVRKLSKLILTQSPRYFRQETADSGSDRQDRNWSVSSTDASLSIRVFWATFIVGKVKNIAENIRAAFIEIADGIMCYYSMHEKVSSSCIQTGKKAASRSRAMSFWCRLGREPIRGKLPCVTCDLNFPGDHLAVTTAVWAMPGFSGKLNAEEKKKD